MGRLTCLKPRIKALDVRRVASTTKETDRLSGGAWQGVRARILRRDNGLCWACQRFGLVSLAREVDHYRPLWAGGTHDQGNLGSLCSEHHTLKTTAEAAQRAAGDAWSPWEPTPLLPTP